MSTSRQHWYNIGPLGFYDCVRLARRGRTTIVRVLYVLALFGALAATYYSTLEELRSAMRGAMRLRFTEAFESINQNALFAERFSITVLVVQNIAVLVLMPIYIAAGIQEERNRRTLPLLFTTHLTAWEIVAGKFLSRVGLVGSVLLSGLPVLAFAQLWGGIDMEMIAANFCNTLLLLLSVGAFSMFMAVGSRSLLAALMKSYLMLPPLILALGACFRANGYFWSSPYLLNPSSGGTNNYVEMWFQVGLLTLGHCAFAFGMLRVAAKRLNRQRGEEPRPAEVAHPRFDKNANRFWRFPPIGDNAVAWKECYLDPSYTVVFVMLSMPMLSCYYLIHISTWVDARRAGQSISVDFLLNLFEWIMIAGIGLFLWLLTLRLTGSIVRERERQSLDSLLLLPITTTEFLHAKVVGNLQRYWPALLPFAATWVVVMIFGDLAPWAGFLLLISVAIHVYFFAMLALFLSAVCETSVSAHVTMGLILLALLVGTIACPILVPGSREFCYALNPVGCWITIIRDWWRQDQYSSLCEIAVCLLFYFAAARVLGAEARRRFHRD
jgi:ABC-type transport system involved in multi-copper enzyme maturation permease subunit